MTRNWLTSSLLPSNYWWLAMKRAVEVSNMLPTFHLKTDNPTTPHELFYGENQTFEHSPQCSPSPTLHNLVSLNAIKCICVGRCSISNGLKFYHPPTKRLFTDGNVVKFDLTLPAGPQFNESYDGSFTFTSKADLDSILHRPLPFTDSSTVYATNPNTNTSSKATVINSPFDPTTDPYILKFDDGPISQHMTEDINDHDPKTPLVDSTTPQAHPVLPWIKHDAKVTLSHPSLTPKWDYLQCNKNEKPDQA